MWRAFVRSFVKRRRCGRVACNLGNERAGRIARLAVHVGPRSHIQESGKRRNFGFRSTAYVRIVEVKRQCSSTRSSRITKLIWRWVWNRWCRCRSTYRRTVG